MLSETVACATVSPHLCIISGVNLSTAACPVHILDVLGCMSFGKNNM